MLLSSFKGVVELAERFHMCIQVGMMKNLCSTKVTNGYRMNCVYASPHVKSCVITSGQYGALSWLNCHV